MSLFICYAACWVAVFCFFVVATVGAAYDTTAAVRAVLLGHHGGHLVPKKREGVLMMMMRLFMPSSPRRSTQGR